jgi:Zinc finger, C3HC4 type (RING finger)
MTVGVYEDSHKTIAHFFEPTAKFSKPPTTIHRSPPSYLFLAYSVSILGLAIYALGLRNFIALPSEARHVFALFEISIDRCNMSTGSNDSIVDAMAILVQDPPASATYPPVIYVAPVLTPNPLPAEDWPTLWETDPVTISIFFIQFYFAIIALCVAKCLDDHGNLLAGRNVPPMSTATLSAGLSAVAQLYQCVVCFDVMAPAMTIIPCGHNICRVCSSRVRECPSCRERINSTVLAWITNSTISRLLEIQRSHEDISIFGSDEVETYNNRIMAPALPNPAAAQLNLQGRPRTVARSQDATGDEVGLRRTPRLGVAPNAPRQLRHLDMVTYRYSRIERDIAAEL